MQPVQGATLGFRLNRDCASWTSDPVANPPNVRVSSRDYLAASFAARTGPAAKRFNARSAVHNVPGCRADQPQQGGGPRASATVTSTS
jgi:hypothetical protein